MNLANPTALFWLALAVPIVIFYILKVRLRRVPVSTSLFWRQIFEQKRPRSLRQRLRHLLSLLLQLLFLALLIVALAEPFSEREVQDARRLVLVIDNSASMNATDGSPTRLDQARKIGRAIVDGLRFRDELAVVQAGNEARVLCGLTGDGRTLRQTLESVPPSDGPTRVADAVALARRMLAGLRYNQKVIVLTDGCFERAPELARAEDVQLIAVGRRTGNVGITRFQVRRSLRDPIGYAALAEVVNASDEPVECRLTLELNDEPVDVVPLSLAANGSWNKVFEATSAAGGRLVARIDRPDALAADNQAVALLPSREVRRVFLVTKGNWFLEKVFEACPLVDLSVVTEPPRPLPAGAITVFHRAVPARLPSGPVFVIDPGGPCDLWQLGDKLANPIVTHQDKDSPLMAYVSLDKILLPEARKLTPGDRLPVQRLATTVTDDPVYCAFERPEGRVLVLTVNLDKSELPLRTAFPILASNALSWLAGHRDELDEAVSTGIVTEVEMPNATVRPAEAQELFLRAPDGRSQRLTPYGNRMPIGPLDQCGVWSIAPAAGSQGAAVPFSREVACNLVNRGESDLRPPDGLNAAAEPSRASIGGQPIWFYLLAAAWLLAAVEWYLYQRRWIS